MDIKHNLLYNENTVRSGDFLEELSGFGEETMHREEKKNSAADGCACEGNIGTGASGKDARKKSKRTGTAGRRGVYLMIYAAVLSVCVILCGCTRKEQLVLEVDAVREETQDGQPGSAQDTGSMYQAPDGQNGGRTSQSLSATGTQKPQEAGGLPGKEPDSAGTAARTIWVHVCGAVGHPGVYELPVGSRVHEAVEKAGGFAEDADESYVNQAQELTDGVKLIIPTLGQTQDMIPEGNSMAAGIVDGPLPDGQADTAKGGAESGQDASDGRININTASETELCNIPGIGATRAAAVVAYRQEHGGFASIEDIMNVSGIKEGTYAKIKDSIKVD